MTERALAGKAALVTGGSRGIGAATAIRLAREGADVAISYRSAAQQAEDVVKAIEKFGVRGAAFAADQSDPEQAAHLVDLVMDSFGRLDILINNAAVFVTGPVDAKDTDLDAFDRQLATNVWGVAATTRAAVRVMSDGGRIVSMSSTAADRTPFPGLGDYSATKAAVAAYTRGWARDLGPRGITVNAVQVSSVSTDMNPDTGPFADTQRSMNALGRYGRPEEIAGTISFLVGPDATFLTGATLNVDGGFMA
ncbi:SDR family NAD(P)-dependent oxidoreductase [Actinopolymorpha pittospori]|uniref:3-oxoacyl-[acyl-carrier protein] reductase n=1 Tax=Actinopolymorpha pittospori TaxID=648752 RepID=A0A927RB94_9ACTN|nr:SDR family oxidoreductase [Actinopolymorpha pittospori]MBE1605850.1 3-oxoacyl-[acyl-carrier protein] reductase [Actinopolymorpha pittospori]